MTVSRLSLAYVCLFAAACQPFVGPMDDLEITVSSNRSVVSSSSPASVTVSITNRGEVAVQVHWNTCLPMFEVLDMDGKLVGPRNGPCPAIADPPVILAPDKTLTLVATWNASALDVGVEESILPPGTYRLRATIAADNELRRSTSIPIAVRE